jgi:hypothetical protein
MFIYYSKIIFKNRICLKYSIIFHWGKGANKKSLHFKYPQFLNMILILTALGLLSLPFLYFGFLFMRLCFLSNVTVRNRRKKQIQKNPKLKIISSLPYKYGFGQTKEFLDRKNAFYALRDLTINSKEPMLYYNFLALEGTLFFS